jgi:hypothetical protein
MSNYARIFIDHAQCGPGPVHVVQSALGVRRAIHIDTGSVAVEIRRNPDDGRADGFLGFPLIAEMYGREGSDRASLVMAVQSVVEGLDSAGFRVVTAAEFEEELPGHGRNEPI